MPFVAHIEGVQGSGKSYICSQLPKKVTCLDTDDYVSDAYWELSKGGKRVTNYKAVTRLAQMWLDEDVAEKKNVVVAGILLRPRNVTNKYFITMDTKQMHEAYCRLLKREIEKFKKLPKLKCTKDPKVMDQTLKYLYHVNAWSPGYGGSFQKYKEYYNSFKAGCRGYKRMSQDRIVDDILASL